MEKDFVPYQPSFDLKELGFNEPCFARHEYIKNELQFPFWNPKNHNEKTGDGINYQFISAPTFSQSFRWFREKYSYQSFISPSNELTYLAYDFTLKGFDGYFKSKQFKTYEEAELECLKKLIEIVKNEKNISNIS